MSAAMDICLLRALSTPSTWPTSVLSVSITTVFGSWFVLRMMSGPLRLLMMPLNFRRLRRGCSGCDAQKQLRYDIGHPE